MLPPSPIPEFPPTVFKTMLPVWKMSLHILTDAFIASSLTKQAFQARQRRAALGPSKSALVFRVRARRFAYPTPFFELQRCDLEGLTVCSGRVPWQSRFHLCLKR